MSFRDKQRDLLLAKYKVLDKGLLEEILNDYEDSEFGLNDLKHDLNEDTVEEVGTYLIRNSESAYEDEHIDAVSELEALRIFINSLGYSIEEV
jgi:hypothetical protein